MSTPTAPRPAAAPLSRLAADVRKIVARQRQQQELAALDDYREHLPIDHPYRHMLDVPADVACSHLVDPAGGAVDA